MPSRSIGTAVCVLLLVVAIPTVAQASIPSRRPLPTWRQLQAHRQVTVLNDVLGKLEAEAVRLQDRRDELPAMMLDPAVRLELLEDIEQLTKAVDDEIGQVVEMRDDLLRRARE